MSTSTVYSVCPHDCQDTCACPTTVENGRATAFGGDPRHADTRGRLCARVNDHLETVHHPDRLLHPLAHLPERRARTSDAGEA